VAPWRTWVGDVQTWASAFDRRHACIPNQLNVTAGAGIRASNQHACLMKLTFFLTCGDRDAV